MTLKWKLFFGGLLVIIGGGLYASLGTFESGSIDTSSWETYQNDEFQFELKHPSDWTVWAGDQFGSPVINVYKKEEPEKPPFIHHTQVTQVSVFPRGIPTEGITGETTVSEVRFYEKIKNAVDYVLSDGSRWATAAGFINPPRAWEGGGFVFSRSGVSDFKTVCIRGGKEISESQCETLGLDRDTIVHSGVLDTRERAIAIKILESIRFIVSQDEEDKKDLIKLYEPKANTTITSPLTVKGEARGFWFFEASFPVYLVDWDGRIIATGIAQAESEWMTEDFVPFTTTLIFETPPYGERGAIILRKDNPSGLPEHDDALEVPIRFDLSGNSGNKEERSAGAYDGCIITGCSGQICGNEETVSTCEYKAEYACFVNAICEQDTSGVCGWRKDSTLSSCLANPSGLE